MRIEVDAIAPIVGTLYPTPFDKPCRKRERRKLGDAAGLTQFGVNLLRLPPGVWSSQRHWHTGSDEFVYILSGEVILLTDSGEELLRAGDAAGFKAGDTNGHCLQNRSDREALVLEIGSRIGRYRLLLGPGFGRAERWPTGYLYTSRWKALRRYSTAWSGRLRNEPR